MKEKVDKGDLYILKEHSTLSDIQLGELLEQKSYADLTDWQKFAKYFTLALGAGLFVLGVLFFFAYNWADLDKNIKFLLVFGLLAICVGGSVYPKFSTLIKQISLLSASVLVGVLFAVFGQVYQTGANAYDLFFMWVLAVTPWTLLNKFSAHWLFYAVLANTTLILYYTQLREEEELFFSVLFMLLLNIALYVIPVLLGKFFSYTVARYYTSLVTFASVALAAAGVVMYIFLSTDNYMRADMSGLYYLVVVSVLWLVGSFLWSRKTKDLLLFSYIYLALFAILFAVLIKIADFNEAALLLYALYTIGGTFAIVKLIMNQKKLWNNEQE